MRQILHISDIHFGPPHLTEVAAGVSALVAERRPELVVVSGDLTQRAKPQQFRDARAFVDRLGVPALAVPGNHDVPLYRVWERALAPFWAYRRHFSRELEPVYQDDEMLVVGINTAYNWTFKNGRLSRRRLAAVCERLAAAPAGLFKVVVAHHHLICPPEFAKHRPVADGKGILGALSDAGAEVVLSGHLHLTYCATSEDLYRLGRRPVLILHSGTTTSNRRRHGERDQNTCNWLTAEPGRLTVEHLRWRPEAGRFSEDSRRAYSRPGMAPIL